LLDDLELALSFSTNNAEELPIEITALARLALIQDSGKDYTYSSALGLGLLNFYKRNENLQSAVALYFDLPTSYRLNSAITFTAVPKIIFPAQFAGISTISGISLGGSYNITDTTQFMAQYTPILSGSNQLIANTSFGANTLSGKTGIYNVGIRQLFPSGNSLYAVDLYFTNSSSDYGLQGISAIANGGKQVGIRFSVLNGVPEPRKD
jgi:hypothetical protein